MISFSEPSMLKHNAEKEPVQEESSALNLFCCGCGEKDISRAENDLRPLKKHLDHKQLQPVPFESDYVFRWTKQVIDRYANVDVMRKQEFCTGSMDKMLI